VFVAEEKLEEEPSEYTPQFKRNTESRSVSRSRVHSLCRFPTHTRLRTSIIASLHFFKPLNPIGSMAAPTPSTPRSVASRLYVLLAFAVSCISTLIPMLSRYALVCELSIHSLLPVPMISRSGFGYSMSSSPNMDGSMLRMPVLESSEPMVEEGPQGRHVNASPPSSSMPDPSVVRMPLFRWKPKVVQASILVAGAAVLRRTSRAPKSVCVSSVDAGPRSCDLGGPVCVRGTAETWEDVVRVRLDGNRRRCDFDDCVIRHAVVEIRGHAAERRARMRSRDGARMAMVIQML
jgi:hypothetical protein